MDCKPTGFLCLGDFLGNNTRVSCHFLLQGIFSTQGWNLLFLYYVWILNHWAAREVQEQAVHITVYLDSNGSWAGLQRRNIAQYLEKQTFPAQWRSLIKGAGQWRTLFWHFHIQSIGQYRWSELCLLKKLQKIPLYAGQSLLGTWSILNALWTFHLMPWLSVSHFFSWLTAWHHEDWLVPCQAFLCAQSWQYLLFVTKTIDLSGLLVQQ